MSLVSHRALRRLSGRLRRVRAAGAFACLVSAMLVLGGAAAVRAANGETVTVPSAPTGVHVTANDGSLAVSWAPPANNGGAALTGYQVNASGGVSGILGCDGMSGQLPPVGQTNSCDVTVTTGPSATSATVTGLTNGRTYSVRVTAGNSVGWGPPSEPVSATPGTPTSSSSTSTMTSSTTTTTAPKPTATTSDNSGPTRARSGYWMVSAEGRVYPFGDALHHGEPATQLGKATAADVEPTKSGNGYWVLDSTGRVFPYGDARWFGNINPTPLVAGERSTSLSRTPSGNGYWVFTNRGRAVTFGDAVSYGDVAAVTLNGPVLDSVATPTGRGYYMVASDGGIFSFGDATFHGSTGNLRLNKPVMGMAPAAGGGYWLVASDGGIFAFDAPFHGSLGAVALNKPISGIVPGSDGYLMVAEDGGIFSFGSVAFHGSLGRRPPAAPVVSAALLR